MTVSVTSPPRLHCRRTRFGRPVIRAAQTIISMRSPGLVQLAAELDVAAAGIAPSRPGTDKRVEHVVGL